MPCSCGTRYDIDYPELYHESFPVAKKEYKCCECGEPIKPGQKHHAATGFWEGDWLTYRTCMTCYRIREDYCGGEFVFGELRDTLLQCLELDYITGEKVIRDV